MVSKNSTSKPVQGLLLLNLGTPEQPTPVAVKKYLKEFLMDPRVIDIPYPLRWVLVNLGILPKRSYSSAAAYQKIWTSRGSPLLIHLMDLNEKVQEKLGTCWRVQAAMRYGQPSIEKAIQEFRDSGIQEVTVVPLYPQYSTAATESSVQECKRLFRKLASSIHYRFIPPFFDQPSFIQAFASIANESIRDFAYDHVLFSFHGLPERQIKKLGLATRQYCRFSRECCEVLNIDNQNCYRAQCFRTAKLIAEKMSLSPKQYTVCFQSRLGRTPWIQPFTDALYQELPVQGVKRLAVLCPSFVSDCLETLEEVAIRGNQQFKEKGGQELLLIPSLNSSAHWVSGLCQIVKDFK